MDPLTKPEWRAGVNQVLSPMWRVGEGDPSGLVAPIGATYRQTDANSTYGNLTGLLWNKVGTGTTLGTDWLVDFEGRWISYTVTWAATGGTPSIGNGTLEGRYTLAGKLATARVYLAFGSTTSVTGMTSWTFTIPQTAASSMYNGSVTVLDSGVSHYVGAVRGLTTTTFEVVFHANGNPAGVSVPHSWGNNDTLTATTTYEVA